GASRRGTSPTFLSGQRRLLRVSQKLGLARLFARLSHASQVAHRPTLPKKQWKPHNAAACKRNEPDDDGSHRCRLLFYSKDQREDKKSGELRTSADAGQLHRRADQRKCKHQRRTAKAQGCK